MNLCNRASLGSIVAAVHAAGVNHGDIEPRNIVVSPSGTVHLIDFSHSGKHMCKGKRHCAELIELEGQINRV